jgi:hypothetical protein
MQRIRSNIISSCPQIRDYSFGCTRPPVHALQSLLLAGTASFALLTGSAHAANFFWTGNAEKDNWFTPEIGCQLVLPPTLSRLFPMLCLSI